jgi:hypothetical protein
MKHTKEEAMGNEKNGSSPLMDPAGEQHMLSYEIRVKGCMDEVFWTEWFGDLEHSIDRDQEETILRGPIVDQAELYGLLSRLRNKGLTLISVLQIRQES